MNTRQFAAVILSAIVLLGFLAYANTFTGGWVWDDVSSVLLHENVQQPSQIVQLFREDQHAFGEGQGNFYRPLLSVSFMIDFLLSYNAEVDLSPLTAKPFLFHFTNIIWHIAAAALLFLLLVRIQAPRIIQAVTPILFVLHPMHTEAVAYISGRADMMSATFILAALLCATIENPSRKTVGTVASAILFIMGLCSKESTMIYPVLLALTIVLMPRPDGSAPCRQVWKARSLPLVVAGAILLGYGALRATVLKFSEGGGGTETGLGQRLLETCQAFAFYIKTLFLPLGLHMEQTLATTPVWTAALGLMALAVCVAIIVWAFRSGNHRVALGFAWFLAAWLPISGIFPLNAPMAEHWMYVPMAGFWWGTLELLLVLSRRMGVRLLVPGLATVLALLFLYGTVHRNQDWNNNESVFRATLAENPDTMRVHSNLATTYEYFDANYPGAERHYKAVLDTFRKNQSEATGILISEIPVRLSLAKVLMRQGKYNEAIEHYSRLLPLAQDPNFTESAAEAALGMGECYLALGDFRTASQAIQQASKVNPELATIGGEVLRGEPLPGRF